MKRDEPAEERRAFRSQKIALEMLRQAGGRLYLPVQGQSMFPLLRPGDRVLVNPAVGDLRRGDIVVFSRDETLYIHRLLIWREGSAGRQYLTKGDNRLLMDVPFTADALLGRALAIERGQRQMSLDTPAWRAINRAIATLMLPLASLMGRLNSSSRGRPSQSVSRGRLAGRAARSGCNGFLRVVAALFSRWQR